MLKIFVSFQMPIVFQERCLLHILFWKKQQPEAALVTARMSSVIFRYLRGGGAWNIRQEEEVQRRWRPTDSVVSKKKNTQLLLGGTFVVSLNI